MTARLLFCACAALMSAACESTPPTITIERAFIVPGAGFAPGVMYADIRNDTADDDTLTRVDIPAARSAMMHESRDSAGRELMSMVHALPVRAHAMSRLAPRGIHVMVDGLAETLARGDTTGVSFAFAGHGTIRATARVIDYADVDSLTRGR
jgi:copper(I)-binding protein